LAKSRGINKGELQSGDDGRFSYHADEFEGALSYITTSVIQDPDASNESLACDDDDDDDDATLRNIPSFSEDIDDSLSQWNLKPRVGTAVIQLLRMRQGSPSSWKNDHESKD
jgi:hypothetical protein